MAEGIDTAVHTATMEMGGKTVAVIGNSLNKEKKLCFLLSEHFIVV